MRVRIKFQKFGAMKFIGHLDVMRYFQKAFRRAKIDNEYTKGYNPHQIMSFAAPLGLGLTSQGEYMDIQLRSSDAPEEMIRRINAVLTEGFKVIGFYILNEPEEGRKPVSAMSLVTAADYMVSLKDGYDDTISFKSQEEFQNAFVKFLNQDKILIDKKTKKSVRTVDIKPMITLLKTEELSSSLKEGVADKYKNGIKIYFQVDTGSRSNLKPELVLEAFYNYYNIDFQEHTWQVHRIEIYTIDKDKEKLIPLSAVGV